MKVIHWKKRYLPDVSWAAYSPGNGIADPIARSKDEMIIKLAAAGYELDCLAPHESNDFIDIWTVRKFPGNSLERNGE